MGYCLMPDARAFMDRALQYHQSARALLDLHDYNSACNRAYYAMFTATKALLIATTTDDTANPARTHRGLSAALYTQLVKPGMMDNDIAALLGKVESLRLSGDYSGEALMQDDAITALQDCALFLDEARRIMDKEHTT